jgi:hypothetical protein
LLPIANAAKVKMASRTTVSPAPGKTMPFESATSPDEIIEPRAGFWRRFLAFVIDVIIVSLPFQVIGATRHPAGSSSPAASLIRFARSLRRRPTGWLLRRRLGPISHGNAAYISLEPRPRDACRLVASPKKEQPPRRCGGDTCLLGTVTPLTAYRSTGS